jgi:SAM-dependent methyltransferase
MNIIRKFKCKLSQEFYQQDIFDRVLFLKHQFAYGYAKKYLQPQMRILDYGCGDGSGAALLAASSPDSSVVGAGIDNNTVRQARKKYKQKNLDFFTINKIRKTSLKFDLIVSFRVIEHVENVANYLNFLKGLLADRGVLILSTPSRSYRLNENQTPWNPYHLREYSFGQFKKEIENIFTVSNFYSLTAISEILEIEFARVASGRLDRKPFNISRLNESRGESESDGEYSINDFYLTRENTDDGLDLFSISVNKD